MNKFIKLFSYYSLLIVSQYLYGSQLSRQHKSYIALLSSKKQKLLVIGYTKSISSIPDVLYDVIQYFLHENPLQYKGKALPSDLSGQDLRGFDFTGCQFTHTNLTDTQLEGAILEDTICDYEVTYAMNFPQPDVFVKAYYLLGYKALPMQLEKMQQSYADLKNSQKAKILQVASGLAWLPFKNKQKCFLRYCYYVSKIYSIVKELKKEKKDRVTNELREFWYFPLAQEIKERIETDCWRSTFVHNYRLSSQVLHHDFDQYVEDFQNGLITYSCQSINPQGFIHYKNSIIRCIKRLKKAYSYIQGQYEKQEVLEIVRLLSRSYQYQKCGLYQHYTACLERMVSLKENLKVKRSIKAVRYVRHSFSNW